MIERGRAHLAAAMRHTVSDAPPARRDERLRNVSWRDLVTLSRGEVWYEAVITLPWLTASLASWHLAATVHPVLALPALLAAFFFFLTGLRQVHNAYHYALGVGRGPTELTMFALSAAMMSSMHAIQATHIHHHRHCLDDEDVEGSAARRSAWQAALYGPLFALRLHVWGWRFAGRGARRWILAEIAALGAMVAAAALVDSVPLRAHVATMLVGQCFTAFFAVWSVHHDCGPERWIARTQRGWLKNVVSYDMFHHVEHHLFPGVPTCHLPELSRRLDAVAPEYKELSVY